MEEEKKEEAVSGESDFADEMAPLEEQKSTLPPEEKIEESPIEEANKWDRVGEAKTVESAEISDERFDQIETHRKEFHSKYKKSNRLRWIVSIAVLSLIIIGYVIPTTVPPMKGSSWGIYITLGVLVVAVAGLFVYSIISKRWINNEMKKYFSSYYSLADSFIYEEDKNGMVGGVDDKLDPALLKEAKTYSGVYKIGSRETLKFELEGKEALVSDCAAQIQNGRQLRTVFVGKMFEVSNDYHGGQILIYIKGFSKGLPPTDLEGKEEIYNDDRLVVYGEKASFASMFGDKEIKMLCEEFDTNNILVDVTISIVEGKTYFFLGYDDVAMVLPLEKPLVTSALSEIKKNYASIKKLVGAIKLDQ